MSQNKSGKGKSGQYGGSEQWSSNLYLHILLFAGDQVLITNDEENRLYNQKIIQRICIVGSTINFYKTEYMAIGKKANHPHLGR